MKACSRVSYLFVENLRINIKENASEKKKKGLALRRVMHVGNVFWSRVGIECSGMQWIETSDWRQWSKEKKQIIKVEVA